MITLLSKDLINKIAAGEVVERPSSVVKELLENSIDALASKIILKIEGGGLEKISVEDNGKGIEKSDLVKLFHKHATSKIKDQEDLGNIVTFGFRGEALASISSVSDTYIYTKSEIDSEGSKVFVEGGEINISQIALNQGTIVEVNNLFKNVPARRKFMKSDKTETSYIVKTFLDIALANPQIEFFLYKDGKEYLHFKKSNDDSRIREIVKNDLLPLRKIYEGEILNIEAALIKPGSLDRLSEQYVFVNKRPIYSPIVQKAIKDAYTSFLKKELRPSFVLFIEISPELVDVNVHPRKIEVRFLDQQKIYSAIYNGSVKYFEDIQKKELSAFINDEDESTKLYSDTVYKIAISSTNLSDRQKSYTSDSNIKRYKNPVDASISFTKNLFDETEVKTEYSAFDKVEFFQLNKKFILYYLDNNLNIVDQHAASERINYEKYSEEFKNKEYSYKVSLFPISIELQNIDYVFVIENLKIFEQYGIIIEDMGVDMISISKFSDLIPEEKLSDVFFDVLSSLKDEGIRNKTKNDERIIASISCRSAIMFGQKLSQYEMRDLVKRLKNCKVSLTCAHGRPTSFSISEEEILKKLARC